MSELDWNGRRGLARGLSWRAMAAGLVVLLALLAAPGTARAAPATAEREAQARADFAAARYQEAVEKFARLYAETADPIYLRNIGRCYQKLRRPREGIDSFQEYLHKAKKLSPAERQEVEGFIRELQALEAAPPAPVPAQPSPAPSPGMGPAASAPANGVPIAPLVPAANAGESVTAAPAAVIVTTDVAPAGADAGRGWRIAGIASAAGGVGLVVAGLAFGAAAENAADSVSQRYSSSTEQDGKRYETLQWVGYGAGVVAIAAAP